MAMLVPKDSFDFQNLTNLKIRKVKKQILMSSYCIF